MGPERPGKPTTPYAWAVLRAMVVSGSVIVAVLAGACSQAGEAPMPSGAVANDQELLTGRAIYINRCQRCHGATGGGGAGSKLAGKMVAKYPDPAAQAEIVANGKGGMPAWRSALDADQIAAVVRYTREVL